MLTYLKISKNFITHANFMVDFAEAIDRHGPANTESNIIVAVCNAFLVINTAAIVLGSINKNYQEQKDHNKQELTILFEIYYL